jgi:hypothetical protein
MLIYLFSNSNTLFLTKNTIRQKGVSLPVFNDNVSVQKHYQYSIITLLPFFIEMLQYDWL